MVMRLYPTPVFAPLGKEMTIYAEVTSNTDITEVRWELTPAANGRFHPAVSAVERRTYAVPGPTGTIARTGYFAVTTLQMTVAGDCTLTAHGDGPNPDSLAETVFALDMTLENEALFVRSIAHNPGFAEPVEPAIEDQTLEINFRVHGDVGGIDEPVANMPVYLNFTPNVVDLYILGTNGVDWEPAGLDLDPFGKGFIINTQGDGVVRVRVGSRERVLGMLDVVVAGETYRVPFVIATFSLTAGDWPAPTGVAGAINLHKETSPTFAPRIPLAAPLDDAEFVMMWMQGKNGIEHYGEVTTPGDLKINGQTFAYSDITNDGTRTNSVAYLVQRGNNAQQSNYLRFSAVGEVPVRPDPSITDRPLAEPTLDAHVVNVFNAKRGLTLTVPAFTAADISPDPADSYLLEVLIYLYGWDHQTGVPRENVLILPAVPYALPAGIPTTDIPFRLAYIDLSGYDRDPQPLHTAGRFMAEYTVTAVTGTGTAAKRVVVHSQILGMNPVIELDTPPEALPPDNVPLTGGEALASARRTIRGVFEPDAD